MTSHKRPVTYFDDPLDEEENPVKRVAFESECIEDELTDQKRVTLLQENPSISSNCCFWDCVPCKLYRKPNIRSAFHFNVKDLSGRYYEPNKYYHVSCIEQIFPDISALVERGILQIEGEGHAAILILLGRTFEGEMYDRFQIAYAEWDREASTVEIKHQFESHEGSSLDCEKCEVPDEPLRKDYFPEEPCSSLLSEVLASVIGVGNLDGVEGDSKEIRLEY
ncbi:uncharacterized protein N7496_006428 [Penicillium cataractarum]|uniref:Uncharacterized protein n=1 Tax=Penicillium cataractarum TaxID=2100454 RepID=A0A9W9S1I4_9EURO|nr:uncharacterized protein N7496_006428 [Penicillium cataractarum]KAJ5370336.1 hypothetical protein N7496_006428 [Penicillium cataractarum]